MNNKNVAVDATNIRQERENALAFLSDAAQDFMDAYYTDGDIKVAVSYLLRAIKYYQTVNEEERNLH